MTRISKDLREFIELLSSHRVEYVLVGGHAVAYHGWPRFTQDIDFFVRPTLENGERLAAALKQFGFDTPDLTPELFAQPKRNIQLGHPPRRIDLLTSISGVDFETAWSSREVAQLDGVVVSIVGRDVLIANKRASGRPKDLADLDHLEPKTPK